MLATLALAGICHADCSETEAAEACVGQHWADSVVPPGFSAYSSLAKCAAATVAGSIFALVGMMIESKKDKKNKPISREDLVLPRTTSTCSSSPVHAPAPAREAECQDSQQQDPDESELKRSQSLPSSQLKRSDTSSSGQRSYTKEKEKGRSDELNWRSTSSRPVRTFSAPVPKPKTVAKPPPSPLSIIGKDLTEMQKVERQVKSILNKLTWEKLDKLYDDLVSYCTVDDQDTRRETVEVIARDVFKKATLQHHFIELYAGLCARLDADLKQRGIEVNFRRALLEQCQESFTTHLAPPQIDSCLDYEDQYEMLVKYKTKMLGNVKLIAHLLRLRMLAAKIIFHCIDELISIGSAEALETLCAFIETLGGTFDKPQWSGYARLQEIFKQVEILADDKKQSARTRCLLKDLLDKRRNAWQEKTTVIASPKSDKEKEKLQKKTIRSEKLDWMEARVSVNSPLSGVSGRRAAA